MDKETLNFTVGRITFQNESNGYSVLKGTSEDDSRKVTVVGTFASINPGEEVRARGVWVVHPTFGMQFQVVSYTLLKPATLTGIEKFLGSGLIKGIGPVTAKTLIDTFGLETIDIIENHPERLAECPGIGKAKADLISNGWFLQRAIQDTMIFLQGHGVSTIYAAKIYNKYGKDTVKIVSDNPYLLAYEIPGMGFRKADAIAKTFDIQGDDLRRVTAGILYALNMMANEGHLYATSEQLNEQMARLLALPASERDLSEAFDLLLLKNQVVSKEHNGKKLYYLPYLFKAEAETASLVKRLLSEKSEVSRESLLKIFDEIKEKGTELTEKQLASVELSLVNKMLVITGGPGTGKTTTLKMLAEAHKAMGRRVVLASPTGRAAKRLSEVSGYEALTIHRLLEYSHKDRGFTYNLYNPLPTGTVIVDEASMIDMRLFHGLIQALPHCATLVLVGDVDQLPSVGAGNVLNEIIKSNVIPVIKLEEIFRQAQNSLIIKNAHLINKGKMPKLLVPDGVVKTDCYFLNAKAVHSVTKLLLNVVGRSLPGRFDLNPLTDIQVLTPMNRGPLGAENLNNLLRELLNPPSEEKDELKIFDRSFRVGDKIIQLRNNYDLEIYNGDIGIISEVDADNQEAKIEFSNGMVTLQSGDLADIAFAYAITIHKAQGSEYPGVVMILAPQHYLLLQRNLVYTGLTRAKKVMVMLGSKEALSIAVNKNTVKRRNSLLGDLLQT